MPQKLSIRSTHQFWLAAPNSIATAFAVRLFAVHVLLFLLATPRMHAVGTVTAWSRDDYGQTNVPASLSNAVAVAAGGYHNLALRADGTVASWGLNTSGQATAPATLTNAIAVAAGWEHSLALRADGTVAAWGRSVYGATNVPKGLSNVVAVAGGDHHTMALRADGTVAAWGNFWDGLDYVPMTVPVGLSNITAVAAGSKNCMALRSDGTVVVWGNNQYNQTSVPTDLDDVVAIAGGNLHCLALHANGTVIAWGWNYFGQTNVPPGLSAVVAVSACADHSLALQSDGIVVGWGDNTYGQTNAPATLANVVAISAGGTHNVALSGNLAPSLKQPLLPQTVLAGVTVALRMSANGTRPYFYQWRVNGTNLPGEIGDSLIVPNVAVSNAGSYSVIISNSVGVTVSSNALLTVLPLTLAANPTNQTVFAGTNVAFSVTCQSVLPLSYQWMLNGTNVDAATNTSLALSNVLMNHAGNYSVIVSNSAGSAISSNGLLTVIPLTLTTQPTNKTALAGSTPSMSVNWQSVLPLSFQWLKDGTNLIGATNNPLLLPGVELGQAGRYAVVVSNSAGTLTSSNALLTVTSFLLSTNPANQTVLAGTNVTFNVACQSFLPLAYQWRLSAVPLAGETNNSLVISNVSMTQAGSYTVIVSNSAGAQTSAKAVLTVLPLVISTNLISQTAFLGSTVTFDPNCQSALPLAYQWQFNGTNLPGANTSPLGLTNVNSSHSGVYSVIVSNSAGILTSSVVSLTVMGAAAWGDSSYGQTNVPAGLSNLVTIAGGYFSLALRRDGTLTTWGGNFPDSTDAPTNLSNVAAMSAGSEHSVALLSDGTVFAWGRNLDGQTKVPLGLSNIVAVACGYYHNLALRSDGTVIGWGRSDYGQTNVPTTLSNVVAVAAGLDHSLALLADGTVTAWGRTNYGQTTVPKSASNVVAIACGASHDLAVRANGTVVAWGSSGSGQTNVPIGLNNIVAVAGGNFHSMALRANGTIAAWGSSQQGQTNVPPWVKMVGSIACGPNHCLAVPATGAPFIASRLSNRNGNRGEKVFFRVEANGTQPLYYRWQHADVDVPGGTNATLQLTNLNFTDAGDYSVVVSNALGNATIPPASLQVLQTPLQLALDNTLVWVTTTSAAWFTQTNETHDGVGAAQSGAITHNQDSRLETSVVGPGTLTYWWKVSSEPDYDFLEFYVDGVLQPGRISGQVSWQQQTQAIPAGLHALRWRYSKDVSDSLGQDTSWLDGVNFVATIIPLEFGATNSTLSVSNDQFNLHLFGTPGVNVVIESSPNLTIWTPVQTNSLPAGGMNLAIPVGTNTQQFFRARSL